ncbi:hypothetical protein R2F61_09835 (plasmid) [Mollicutes bacterium LVI A0078]|nr:hypothetical protein R2F61_09835 [Mollicutes bacterium LVI A0078]
MGNNSISDITPLSGLTNLTDLDLGTQTINLKILLLITMMNYFTLLLISME